MVLLGCPIFRATLSMVMRQSEVIRGHQRSSEVAIIDGVSAMVGAFFRGMTQGHGQCLGHAGTRVRAKLGLSGKGINRVLDGTTALQVMLLGSAPGGATEIGTGEPEAGEMNSVVNQLVYCASVHAGAWEGNP